MKNIDKDFLDYTDGTKEGIILTLLANEEFKNQIKISKKFNFDSLIQIKKENLK